MKTKYLLVVLFLGGALFSCEDDDNYISPSLDGLTLDVGVGGEMQPNQVYVNLFTGKQTVTERTSWDLGFYSGSDFRVVINSAAESLVKRIVANDLTQVTADDTIGLGSKLSIDAIFNAVVVPPPPAWVAESVEWVDDPTGDITNTAIDEISMVDSENMVYVINRGLSPSGTSLGWMKFRVVRSGEGYLVEYAPIASSTFETMTISKDANMNFVQFNFDNGLVDAEPRKMDWQITFSTSVQILNFGVDFPYKVKDFVSLNTYLVSASEVVFINGEDILSEFENFSRSDASSLTFSSDKDVIGSNWRTVASPTPGSVTAVKSDRFYVIKDATGNYYKLIFTAMLNGSGERGYPQFKYQLIN